MQHKARPRDLRRADKSAVGCCCTLLSCIPWAIDRPHHANTGHRIHQQVQVIFRTSGMAGRTAFCAAPWQLRKLPTWQQIARPGELRGKQTWLQASACIQMPMSKYVITVGSHRTDERRVGPSCGTLRCTAPAGGSGPSWSSSTPRPVKSRACAYASSVPAWCDMLTRWF